MNTIKLVECGHYIIFMYPFHMALAICTCISA